MIISIAVGPNEVRPQKPIHVFFLTDDKSEKGPVVVNLLPRKFDKASESYFDDMPQFIFKEKMRQLSFDDPAHKNYVDSIIAEIGLLLKGESTHDKCKNRQFEIADIHVKGIERLDDQLAHYFKEQVQQKYDKEFFERPRKDNLNFYTIETPDNAILESVEVSSTEEQMKPISERKFVIVCMARNQNYMYWLKDFNTSATHIGCTVIGLIIAELITAKVRSGRNMTWLMTLFLRRNVYSL